MGKSKKIQKGGLKHSIKRIKKRIKTKHILLFALAVVVIYLFSIACNYRYVGFDYKSKIIERNIALSEITSADGIETNGNTLNFTVDSPSFVIQTVGFVNNICIYAKNLTQSLSGTVVLSGDTNFDKNEAIPFKLKNGNNFISFPYNTDMQYAKVQLQNANDQQAELATICVNDMRTLRTHTIVQFVLSIIIIFLIVLAVYLQKKPPDSLRSLVNAPAVNKLRTIVNSKLFLFILCGIIGGIAFIIIYGTKVLNFAYADWLLSGAGGDTAQHYIGWQFFRNSAWHFPIGLSDNIVYPFKETIIFTDSIPLFAVIFKILSPLLPATFQYFGLFGILCYILQGGIAGLIIKRLCGGTLLPALGSVFFTLSTVMAWRMYAHTALACHLIILLTIYICLTKNDRRFNPIKTAIKWTAVLCLAAAIHLYFVPMVIIFMVFSGLDDCLKERNKKVILQTLLGVVVSTVCMIFILFILGAFYSGAPKAGGGLGFYSTNILSMFNPGGMSAYIKDIALAIAGQYEGNAYLGFGIILGIVLAAAAFVKNLKAIQGQLLENKDYFRWTMLIAGLILAFLVFALSPTVCFGNHVAFVYQIPRQLSDIWNIFRASGRVIWVVVYVITALTIWAIRKEYKPGAALFIIAVLLCVQIGDIHRYLDNKGKGFRDGTEFKTELPSPVWSELAKEDKHIVFLNDLIKQNSVAELAVENKMTLNDFYLARKNNKAINENKANEIANILNGNADDNTIYILGDVSSVPKNIFSLMGKANIFNIDNTFVLLKNDKSVLASGIQPLGVVGLDIKPSNNINMRSAEDTNDGKRILHKGGAVWSDYFDLPIGSYIFTWEGDNFDKANFDVSYETGADTLDSTIIERSNNKVVLSLKLDKPEFNVHTRCFNKSYEDITVNAISISASV